MPGAFGEVDRVALNLQHDPALVLAPAAVLIDSPRELRVRADLAEGSAALELTRRGALNGFSIEFHSRLERREGGIRVVERAELTGLALVDRGAYPGSMAEVRARGGRGGRLGTFRGRIPAGKRVDCRCSPGDCKSAIFKKGSFDDLDDPDRAGDVLGVAGDYSQAVASKTRKSLRFWAGKDGALEYAIDIPNSARGQALLESFDVVPIYGRPVIDVDASDLDIADRVATYSRARVRVITIGPTDASAGWTPLVMGQLGEEAPEAREAPGASRRRVMWL